MVGGLSEPQAKTADDSCLLRRCERDCSYRKAAARRAATDPLR